MRGWRPASSGCGCSCCSRSRGAARCHAARRECWPASTSLLVVLRYADVTVPALFGRTLSLYWDVPQLPRFFWVAVTGGAWPQAIAGLTVLVLLGWGLHRLLRLSIEVVAREAVPYALRARWTWLATAVALGLVLANLRRRTRHLAAGVEARAADLLAPAPPARRGCFTGAHGSCPAGDLGRGRRAGEREQPRARGTAGA